MCYCNCTYEHFNPLTGDCHCKRGKNPCPEDIEEEVFTCLNCNYEFIPDNIENFLCPNCELICSEM